jgi:RimJ/RimL family protein N-acetyltransferase
MMPLRPPTIETPRLILRGWNDGDVEPWAGMNARDESFENAKRMRADLEERGYGWFVVEMKDRPGFLGVVAIDDIRYDVPFQPRREIGWRLPVHAWGHGFASEGATALLDYAFSMLGWREIVSFTAARNGASRRVMERIGMTGSPASPARALPQN